jgi:urease accessory protein
VGGISRPTGYFCLNRHDGGDGGAPPLALAAVLVGMFAIFHGYAHGAELPPDANALSYFLGFVVGTGMLHLAGISFGLLSRWPVGQIAVRAAGGAIALAGVVFLL